MKGTVQEPKLPNWELYSSFFPNGVIVSLEHKSTHYIFTIVASSTSLFFEVNKADYKLSGSGLSGRNRELIENQECRKDVKAIAKNLGATASDLEMINIQGLDPKGGMGIPTRFKLNTNQTRPRLPDNMKEHDWYLNVLKTEDIRLNCDIERDGFATFRVYEFPHSGVGIKFELPCAEALIFAERFHADVKYIQLLKSCKMPNKRRAMVWNYNKRTKKSSKSMIDKMLF